MSGQPIYLEYATGNANFGGHTRLIIDDHTVKVIHATSKEVREYDGTIAEEALLQLIELEKQLSSTSAVEGIPPGSMRVTVKSKVAGEERDIVFWTHETHLNPSTQSFQKAIQALIKTTTDGAVTK